MSQDPHAEFDQSILDKIEHSPIGALAVTPTFQDALIRLIAARRVYVHADHKGGYVTARSLASRPLFFAENLEAFMAGAISEEALESNGSIYDRYVRSLPPTLQARAEKDRVMVIGKPAHHRAKQGVAAVHDPLHALFLVPGAGPNPGLAGNYLHGSVFHTGDEATGSWVVQVHDSLDGASEISRPTLAEALTLMQEVLASAPFHLVELNALGFRMT